MNASRSTKSFTLALAALFLLSTFPARAGGLPAPAGEFDLELDKALSSMGDEPSNLELEFDAGIAGAETPVRLAELSSTAVKEMWTSSQVSAQTSSGSSSGKKGSWLKRKWWIPVLVAVVAGAALSGGDGDNNDDDGED